MNRKRNLALTKIMYQFAVHIQNAYGIEEAPNLYDFYEEGDRVALDYIHKLLICFLRALGLNEWAVRFQSFKTLVSQFDVFLKEFGIIYSSSSIYYNTDGDVIFPEEDEEYKRAIGEQLDELHDPAIKDIIMDQLVNWTHESGSIIDEDVEFRTWILSNAEFIYLEVSKSLAEHFSIYMENAAPSALAWCIGKKETETSVTYIYMGPGEIVSEDGCSYGIDTIEIFNFTFFFPLIEHIVRTRQGKSKAINAIEKCA